MTKYKLRRLFKKLEILLKDILGINNTLFVEYNEENQIMNIEINECGFQAHFSYGDLDEGDGDEFLFIFDRRVHPVVIAHLVNFGKEVFGKLHILDPYFSNAKERYTGIEAEEMYTNWLETEIMGNAMMFLDAAEGEQIH